jgi:hypothetical protein
LISGYDKTISSAFSTLERQNPHAVVNLARGFERSTILDRVPKEFMPNAKNQGIFYYLGTKGYTKPFENPSSLKLVNTFSSTLHSGRPGYVIGDLQ